MESNRILVAVLLIVSGMATACTRTVVYKEDSHGPILVDEKNGPPAHAPAYGYRRNHEGDDVVLVYDPTLKVYVVSDYDDCYYSSGQYFRFVSNQWEWSVSLGGTWKIVSRMSEVPPGLRDHHGHGKAKGHHKH